MEWILSSHGVEDLGMFAARRSPIKSFRVAAQQVTHEDPQVVVSCGLHCNIPRPGTGMEYETFFRKVLDHAVVVGLSHFSHRVWTVEHRLLGRRLAPARTAALLEVVPRMLRHLPANETELCKADAHHVVTAVFEGEDVAATWTDLEIFTSHLTLDRCGYFLWIDPRFPLGRSFRDTIEELGREDGCKVLCVENVRAKSRRSGVVVFECQLEYARNARRTDQVSIFSLPRLIFDRVVV